jgi:voltage-gated potassium channel
VPKLHRAIRARQRLYNILDLGPGAGGMDAVVNWLLIALIVATLIATVLESVPRFALAYRNIFEIIEAVALATFSMEYAARIWTAVEHPPWRRFGPVWSRLHFMASPAGLIDLAAVLPFWLSFLIAADFRLFLVLRLIRFFKLTRYSPAMRSLLEALYAERRALVGCFVILCGATLIAAALMHLAEGAAQPEKFGTIPDAMWWAIVTLGTIGYGDAVPVTVVGRLIAGLTIFVGLLMVALPVGIVATAFANEVHRRDFVVTWGLVARIPLAQKVDKGTTIARRGEPAHSMYLIADGKVEIRLHHQHVHLGAGDFFGEIAALRQSRRSATVVALQTTRLLALDASDLRGLMDREPQIASRIWEAARTRLGKELETAAGDLVPVELPNAGMEQD